MSSLLAMDQAEKVGLGAAVGGHALLLALLLLGLFQAVRPSGSDGGGSAGDGIAVSIVSEDGANAPAPAPNVAELVPAVEEQVEVLPEETPEPVVFKQPQPKKVAQKTPVQKTPVKENPRKGGFGSADYERRLREEAERERQGRGGDRQDEGQGGGQGANTEAEIRAARATISGQIRIGNCMPTGVDVNKVTTRVTVKLAKDGALVAITEVAQSGQTPSNRAQLEPIKRCIVDSIKKIKRFTGLDPKTHSSWQLINVPFKSRG